MRIITLNTHSKPDENCDKYISIIAKAVTELKPAVICLQEVNQTITKKIVQKPFIHNSYPLKEDNYGLRIKDLIEKNGMQCEYLWYGFKKAYSRYEEGIGIISLSPVVSSGAFYISNSRDRDNYKTRAVLGLKTENCNFYSVHTGRWDDIEEPFYKQWVKLNNKTESIENSWLCGDFNCPYGGEGYDAIINNGWRDCYTASEYKDEGYTVCEAIDGWKENSRKMRIDYIFTNSNVKIKSCKTIFDGKLFPVVSDHFGVMAEI